MTCDTVINVGTLLVAGVGVYFGLKQLWVAEQAVLSSAYFVWMSLVQDDRVRNARKALLDFHDHSRTLDRYPEVADWPKEVYDAGQIVCETYTRVAIGIENKRLTDKITIQSIIPPLKKCGPIAWRVAKHRQELNNRPGLWAEFGRFLLNQNIITRGKLGQSAGKSELQNDG